MPYALFTDPDSVHEFNKATHTRNSPYNYVPTEWIAILYVVLFSITTLIHVGQAVRYRLWWLFVTVVLAGISEILGWSGRLWSSINPDLLSPFLMQITTTIIAPTPLIAANFIMLGQLIRRLGSCYSRLSAMWYTIVFVSCDIVALIVQAVGGANASLAVQNGNSPNKGGHIMLGGIVFQMAAITVYMIFAAEFLVRYVLDKPFKRGDAPAVKAYNLDKKKKLMLLELTISSVLIYIRSIYRTIELANGWTGVIISTQWLFNVFDAAMITLAMYSLNVLHPGLLLGPGPAWTDDSDVMKHVGAASVDGSSHVGEHAPEKAEA
ncbi:RTA1-domain-containing protein [Obba rivulosa]|uniref:RTA1-domain-containing protein n=1 Tax=Obba rivulosa TaxID=1052685 RepID=A0A8E2AK29_9APHY|nr:RTA1-domain-containing protein [Obba rivulosa]